MMEHILKMIRATDFWKEDTAFLVETNGHNHRLVGCPSNHVYLDGFDEDMGCHLADMVNLYKFVETRGGMKPEWVN